MPRHDLAWHQGDVAAERAEYEEARGFVPVWSEMSDVTYTVTRARWGGHRVAFPLGFFRFLAGLVYMFPKYTLRFLFFRTAGRMVDPTANVHAVRNPRKTEKLFRVAEEFHLDAEKFEAACKKLLRFWPLLP